MCSGREGLGKDCVPLCFSHSSVIHFVFIFLLTQPHFHDAWPKHIIKTEVQVMSKLCYHTIMVQGGVQYPAVAAFMDPLLENDSLGLWIFMIIVYCCCCFYLICTQIVCRITCCCTLQDILLVFDQNESIQYMNNQEQTSSFLTQHNCLCDV